MADPSNPFDEPESERTVIRPTPGPLRAKRKAAEAAAPALPAASSAAPESDQPLTFDGKLAGANPIIAAAGPLMALAVRLRGSAAQENVRALRERIERELNQVKQTLRASGLKSETVDKADFILCALIDDLVLQTPWAVEAGKFNWARPSLAGRRHDGVVGGDKFFEVLQKLQDDPSPNIDLLELMYLCLSLGFEGRLRGEANGPAKLAKLRETLHAAIRRQRGDFERELSPHWMGVQAAHKPLGSAVPFWVFGLASAALLMAVFIGFSWVISNASNPVFAEIARLPPTMPADIRPPLPRPPPRIVATLRTELAPEIARRIVEVRDDPRAVSVAIHGSGSFPSGSANLEGAYASMIGRIGEAIEVDRDLGRVSVSGHTDNIPIHTIRFPSNYELSLARAQAARDAIRSKLSNPDRVMAEGHADNEPVGDNKTAEGREQNRRIEVIILKRPQG